MNGKLLRWGVFGLVIGILASPALAETGGLVRQPNTTLRMPLSLPLSEFRTESTFAPLRFNRPVVIVTPPGETDRIFVVEQSGIIVVIDNLDQPERTIFLDIRDRVDDTGNEEGLLGLAFHPNYRENRQFFVFYSTRRNARRSRENRLSRFEISADNQNAADRESEVIFFSQPDDASNHNGGDLHFGPDGYLYVAVGDEGAANDSHNNSQIITKDLFAGILRLDVDKRLGSLPANPHEAVTDNYAIPPDNPYVGATTFLGRPIASDRVRTEFWAVGLRNPWRMYFDPVTGLLYCADVGQNAVEEIDIIERGGNYGWAFREGTRAGPKGGRPRGMSFNDPIAEYSHGSGMFQGRSVTGGVVYRGDRFPELYGAYVFADYVSGNIWWIRHEGGETTPMVHLARNAGISAFGIDPRNGDILLAALNEGRLKRLVRTGTASGDPLPERLSDTGVFSDFQNLAVHDGVVPYELNLPFWSDAAIKTRWFSVPDVAQRIGFRTEGNWTFPAGSVWIKHFDLEMVVGDPSSSRRIETRFIVNGPEGVYGVTYRWNEDASDAELVPEEGMNEVFEIEDGGQTRSQVWRYPSRSGCLACHTATSAGVLGFHTAQLNRSIDYGHGEVEQLQALGDAGYFELPPVEVTAMPALAALEDESISLEHRVRSYLDANCSQCHQPGGAAQGQFDARIETPTPLTGLIDGELINRLGDPDNVVVHRGDPDRSILLQRIRQRGELTQMPPIASNERDTQAIELIRRWIVEALPSYRTYEEWQGEHFADANAPDSGRLDDADGDGATNFAEFLTDTDPRAADDVWRVQVSSESGRLRLRFPQVANRAFEIQSTTALSDPFSWRAVRLPAAGLRFRSESLMRDLALTVGSEPGRYFRVRIQAP